MPTFKPEVTLPLFLPLMPTMAQVQMQASSTTLPTEADAYYKAKNWAALADWFDAAAPATRGKFYPYWLETLQRCQRWDRLLAVCEALQPQLEATSGPKLGIYRKHRAQALVKLGRHAEAAQVFAENARLGDVVGFAEACTEARLAEDWTHLLAYAEELQKRYPKDSNCIGWKGEALVQLYRLAEAEPVLRMAVETDPHNIWAWNNLGHCLNERKAWAEACTAFDKALELNPKMLEGLFNRGRARFELKRYKESRDDFRAALALQPDNPVVAVNLRQAERYAALPAVPLPKPKKR